MADPISSRLIVEAARLVRLEHAADESEWAGTARQLDRHHEMHTDAGVRLRDLADEVRALEAAHAVSTDTQHCGHPAACISSAAEGTSYCAWCEDVAQAQAERDDADTLRDASTRDRAALLSRYYDEATELCDLVPLAETGDDRMHGVHLAIVDALADAHEAGRDEVSADLTVLAFGVRDALARGTTPAVRIARKDLADAVLAVVVERDEARDLLRRADLIVSALLAEFDDPLDLDFIDAWIEDSRPHIAAAVERHESPGRGDEG